jgi:hypothetical protein
LLIPKAARIELMLGCCSAMLLLWGASAEIILLASGETSREKAEENSKA